MTRLSTPALIARKRDGGVHSAEDIRQLIDGFVRGEVADYQMSAWAMAVLWRGMNAAETAALTLAMRDSGSQLDLRGIGRPILDKHSTGGVGDKVSLCLAPWVAACGLAVPMIAGRGLGHTGGTIDKLASIPGYRTTLSPAAIVAQLADVGVAIVGQSDDIAPADRRLYALRDVTATVESVPLITASILSKKLAADLDGLVLDVKVGRGAFMPDLPAAEQLAQSLIDTGAIAGLRVRALLTAMDQPLGRCIGNALEVAEAIAVLRGDGPPDLVQCTRELGMAMLELGGLAQDRDAAAALLDQALASGQALATMRAWIAAQGGDAGVIDDVQRLPQAPHRQAVLPAEPVPRQGCFVQSIDARALGLLAVRLGAGRTRADAAIDPAVGIELAKQTGDAVEAGEPLAYLHLRQPDEGEAASALRAAIALAERAPTSTALVWKRLG